MRLKDQNVIITGAGAGIGRESSLLFAAEGARVVVVDFDAVTGRETAELVTAQGGRADFLQVDVGDTAAVKEMIRQSLDMCGTMDVLFNNVGIVPEGTIEDSTEEDWDLAMDVNARSVFVASKAIIPHMRERQSGCILSTSSIAGLKGMTNRCVYCATKAAVISLTMYLAHEYAKDHIRANCLSPGTVDSPSLKGRLAATDDPEAKRKHFINRQPLKRFAQPEEIARGALYLATEPFVTGTNLVIDGGFMAC
jgi:NAD(P)-dependent dehydrogenase (short-subunit alcohol dehydrogenase family)